MFNTLGRPGVNISDLPVSRAGDTVLSFGFFVNGVNVQDNCDAGSCDLVFCDVIYFVQVAVILRTLVKKKKIEAESRVIIIFCCAVLCNVKRKYKT